MMNMSVREKASSVIIQGSAHARMDIFKKPELRNVSLVILLLPISKYIVLGGIGKQCRPKSCAAKCGV